jgi:Lon protease-like protein
VVLLQTGDSVQEGRAHAEPARPFMVGTLARITEVSKLEDGEGMLLITTVGTERFRLLEYRNDKPYMTGDIETWPDEPEEVEDGVIPETVARVRLVFEQYLRLLMEMAGKRIKSLDIPTDPEVLSFLIPNWLYISVQDKQGLLEAPGLRLRLESELQILETETAFFQKIKARAGQPGGQPNASEEVAIAGETEDAAWKESYKYNLRDRFSSN